jgi:alkylation response protein AidB-like acyl-CoA dehydrogenase
VTAVVFAFDADQIAFRNELREFLAEPRVHDARDRLAQRGPFEDGDVRDVHRWLGERGWLAPGWPVEYGGSGRSPIEAAIVHEELVRHGLPDLVYVVTICYVGGFLLLAGNERLRQDYLPRLARGEATACTLYTETTAGSDLGSLATHARRTKSGWAIYGTKVYSQTTHVADYAIVAARTATAEPAGHDGITLFWLPLSSPGVTVRRVVNMSDDVFSDVVLDGVQIPEDHVIGEVGQGWRLLNAALSLERTGLEAHLKMRSWLDAVTARAAATGRLDDPLVTDALVALDSQVVAGGRMAWEIIANHARGRIDDAAAAMSKWYNTELGRPIGRLALDLDGLDGTLSRWDGAAPIAGRMEAALREAPGLTISAGTSEIMLYAVSAGSLGMNGADAGTARRHDHFPDLRERVAGLTSLAATRSREHDRGMAEAAVADAAGLAADWSLMVEQDLVRLALPAAAGGLGRGLLAGLVVAEELGATLCRSPLPDTATVAELLATDNAPADDLVRSIVAGTRRLALALSPFDEPSVTLTGTPPNPRLRGTASAVQFAASVDALVIEARGDAGRCLVLIETGHDGISVRRRDDIARGDLYDVEITDIPLTSAAIVCHGPSPEAERLVERLRLRQAAYLAGIARTALDLTLAYVHERKQFGRAIGTFQHPAFRLAALASRREAAQALLYQAAADYDRGELEPGAAAATLALTAELARDITADAIQLHGAVSILDRSEVQRLYRHAVVESVRLGTPARLRAAAGPALRGRLRDVPDLSVRRSDDRP